MTIILLYLLTLGSGEDGRAVLDKAWHTITAGESVDTVLLVYGEDKQYRQPKQIVRRLALDLKHPKWRHVFLNYGEVCGSIFDGETFLNFYGLRSTKEESIKRWLSWFPILLTNPDLEVNLVERAIQQGEHRTKIEICHEGEHLADLWFDDAYHLKRARYSLLYKSRPAETNYYFGPYRHELPRWPSYWQRGDRHPRNYELLQFEINPQLDESLFSTLEGTP